MELYVHLPFCVKKCRYCDFVSYAGCEDRMEMYVQSLLKEAESRVTEEAVETVYLGGGTPSLLPPALLDQLLSGLRDRFRILPDAEFTSEANPGTLTEKWLETAVNGGVNRLSMGMQASQQELLSMLGRIHRPEDTANSVLMARQAGIRNLNLDLMFGLPGQTLAQWQESLETALAMQPQHLSCYGLIPEDGTPLKAELDTGCLHLPDEETEREMYELARVKTAQAGMTQYEISNFALPGYECKHNLGYWQQASWIGLGASAASMQPDPGGKYAWIRTVNPAGLDAYFRMVRGEDRQRTREEITLHEAAFERMMLGLRTMRGVSDQRFEKDFGQTVTDRFGTAVMDSLMERGLLIHQDGAWRLTRKGMDVQNAVLLELMED